MSEYKWIAQDEDGFIKGFPKNEPYINSGRDSYISHGADWDKIQGSKAIKIKPLLINLETHDYKIEDGILMKVDKEKIIHNDDIQWRYIGTKEWKSVYQKDIEFRIKPKTVKFRNYIDKNGLICHSTQDIPESAIWSSDWIEVEIPSLPDQQWPTELVARIAKIDLQAAEWLRDNWDKLDKYYGIGCANKYSEKLNDMICFSITPQGDEFWWAIKDQLGE